MKQLKNTYGFTLMEVLIATAILAIVLSIVYGSFVQTRKVIGRAEGAVDELRGVRTAFSRITSDISMAFIAREDENTFFAGKDADAGSYPDDSIDFTSYSHRIRDKNAKESDQGEVGYYIKRDFEGKTVLMKREKKRIDKDPMYGGKAYEISEDIVGLNFRYREEDAWLDSWNSTASHTLPKAVEITIIIKDITGAERSYKTMKEIPLWKGDHE